MRVSTLQRKCALIQKLCLKLEDWPSSSGQSVPALGISRTSFMKWLEGRVAEPKPSVLKAADEKLRAYLTEHGLDATTQDNLLSNNVGVMALGEMLGLTRYECRLAIDIMVGRVAPTFSIFSQNQTTINSLLSSFEGISYVYRVEKTHAAKDRTGTYENILRMPLAVRYAIDTHKVMAKGLQRIRCRLEVMEYRTAAPNHQYDGYLTPKDGGGQHYHWFFQSRMDRDSDVIYMITHDPQQVLHDDPSSQRYILGSMFTRTQDQTPIAAVWPIVILPLSENEQNILSQTNTHEDVETVMMRDTPRLMSYDEVDPFVHEKLKEASDLVRFMTL